MKEPLNIKNDLIDVINIEKLKEFFKTKNIELKGDEITDLQNTYKVNVENEEENNYKDYINYDMFAQKLLSIMQNLSDNDEDFLENIPVMDIGGME